jgi:hypothetical protein
MSTQQELKELFDYDAATGHLIWKVDRGTNKMKGRLAGFLIKKGFIKIKINYVFYCEHRLVWMWHFGEMPLLDIEHINANKSDNRIENLREITKSEIRHRSKKAPLNKTSGFLGVYKHKNKWRAKIKLNSKQIHLGTFDNPEEAHQAYLAKKRELHPFGVFA